MSFFGDKKCVNDCLICFECSNIKDLSKLKNNLNYNSSCNCDGYVHNECLLLWLNKSKKCIICCCNLEIISNTNTNTLVKNDNFKFKYQYARIYSFNELHNLCFLFYYFVISCLIIKSCFIFYSNYYS